MIVSKKYGTLNAQKHKRRQAQAQVNKTQHIQIDVLLIFSEKINTTLLASAFTVAFIHASITGTKHSRVLRTNYQRRRYNPAHTPE
jgi:ABC-type uncharacterized transport system YnjBCD permease subunit